MQVFLPYPEPIEVAMCLDKRRLNRQIQEGNIIILAIMGAKAWSHHPVVLMYKDHLDWLSCYVESLACYAQGNTHIAALFSKYADSIRPDFFCDDLYIAHRRRLYTKMPEYYTDFAQYGKSEENWYFVDGEFVKYIKGKKQ